MEHNAEVISLGNSEITEDVSVMSGELSTFNSAVNPPSSGSDNSQQQYSVSRNSSANTISLEERLRRVRAAEQLKQQQLYAAYLESQAQADAARKRQQEERKRKIEEMRQREEARRKSVIERRRTLEQSNKLRIEKLRERSVNRMTTSTIIPRKSDRADTYNRTASASPYLGGGGYQRNGIMTSSCILGFGSSVPRSICTQPNQSALHLKQQAFEARLASYLTGRHSGCFLTERASPYYACYLQLNHLNVSSSVAVRFRPHAPQNSCSRGHTVVRRANSAHSSLRLTKGCSFTPNLHLLPTHTASAVRIQSRNVRNAVRSRDVNNTVNHRNDDDDDVKDQRSRSRRRNRLAVDQTNKVSSERVHSSHECDKIGQSNQVTKDRVARGGSRRGGSNASSRSTSADCRARSNDSLSVFDRLSVPKKSRTVDTQENSNHVVAVRTRKESSNAHPKSAPTMKPLVPPPRKEAPKVSNKIEEPLTTESISSTTDSIELKPVPLNETKKAELVETSELKSEPLNETKRLETIETYYQINGKSTERAQMMGPLQVETHGAGEGSALSENDAAIYRAKLAEQRRLAKERKEEEQRRLEEDNRRRRAQQEQIRLAAEREKLEQEVREAEEAQRRKAAEEMTRLQAVEAERLAKLQKEEEERSLRRQRVGSIMSRFKHGSGSNKALNEQSTDNSNPPSPTRDCTEQNQTRMFDPSTPPDLQQSNTIPSPTTQSMGLSVMLEPGSQVPDSTDDQLTVLSNPDSSPNPNSSSSSGAGAEAVVTTTTSTKDEFFGDNIVTTSVNDTTNVMNNGQSDSSPDFCENNTLDRTLICNGNVGTTSHSPYAANDEQQSDSCLDHSVQSSVHSTSKPSGTNLSANNSLSGSSTSIAYSLAQSQSYGNLAVNATEPTSSTDSKTMNTNNSSNIDDAELYMNNGFVSQKVQQFSGSGPADSLSTRNRSDSLGSSSDLHVKTNSTVNPPVFKSPLLRNMMRGGRLSVHARDAVIVPRRGSYNQLSDMQNDESGSQGDGTSFRKVNTDVNFNTSNGNGYAGDSVYPDGTTRVNGSN